MCVCVYVFGYMALMHEITSSREGRLPPMQIHQSIVLLPWTMNGSENADDQAEVEDPLDPARRRFSATNELH